MCTFPITLLLAMLGAEPQPAPPQGIQGQDYDSFGVDGFRGVLGNNAALGQHANRYNGVFNITHPGLAESPFVEAYAGLNLEHYFDGRARPADSNVFFEPRVAPMTFTRIDNVTAELHQPPTPVFGVESWSRFTLRSPHYIDLDFRCIPHRDAFEGGFFGVFWASYINAPEDKSLYFLRAGSTLDQPFWEQFCTQKHGQDSSVLQADDAANTPFSAPGDMLYAVPAQLRYGERFFYGRVRDHVLIYVFAPGSVVRFAHSPSGGGATAAGDASNPAWDFQMIVPEYRIGQKYALHMRLVCKPWAGRADVLSEVRKYLTEAAVRDSR